MATRKPLATSAQRRAYRSVTTRSQRQTLRAAQPSKRSYARVVGAAGAQIRRARLEKGQNPNTGEGRKVTPSGVAKRISRIKRSNPGMGTVAAGRLAIKRAKRY